MSKGGYVAVNENSTIYCNVMFAPKEPGFYNTEIILESISPKVRFDTYKIYGLCTSDYKYLSNILDVEENTYQEGLLYYKCINSWIENIHTKIEEKMEGEEDVEEEEGEREEEGIKYIYLIY